MNEREQEIAAREKAATPGPWCRPSFSTSAENCGYVVATGEGSDAPVIADICAGLKAYGRPQDADFIAHAREDIPHLLAQLADREKKLAAVEKLGVAAAGCPSKDDEWWIRELDRILQGDE